MRTWFLFATLILAPLTVQAQTAPAPIGAGISTCRHFTATVTFGNPAHIAYFTEWAMGYLAGRVDQGATLDGETPEAFVDFATLTQALVKQCKGNGDDPFVDAVREVAADRFGR